MVTQTFPRSLRGTGFCRGHAMPTFQEDVGSPLMLCRCVRCPVCWKLKANVDPFLYEWLSLPPSLPACGGTLKWITSWGGGGWGGGYLPLFCHVLGCITTHWHQQEHQGLGCVTTHSRQQERQGLGCVTTNLQQQEHQGDIKMLLCST